MDVLIVWSYRYLQKYTLIRWSYSDYLQWILGDHIALIFYKYLQIMQSFVGDNIEFGDDKCIQDQRACQYSWWSCDHNWLVWLSWKIVWYLHKILILYKKAHLWAINFTITVWSYRNYQKQYGNLMITWSFDMISAYTIFMVLIRSKGIMLMLWIMWLKLSNEHKGIGAC